MSHAIRALLLLASATAAAPAAGPPGAPAFFFQPRDRIVFYGDSITEQNGYTAFMEYYLITRFPQWDLVFFNAAASGDTARGGNTRLERDVISERPTAVTVNFGMNDGRYLPPDAKTRDNYLQQQDALVNRLREKGIRVALLTTSPVEARKRLDGDAYNKTLTSFAIGLKTVAARRRARYIDQFHPSLKVLRKMADDKTRFVCFNDGVHTNNNGAVLMAHSILSGMHAPALVSSAVLAASGKVIATERCRITEAAVRGGKLSFTRTDEALPLVVTADQKPLLPYLDHLSSLNRYRLKVTGASAEKYALSIDGQKVAVLSREDLTAGVELSRYNLGPITAQSAAVFRALAEKNFLAFYRFKNTRPLPPAFPPGLSAEERARINEIRGKLQTALDEMLEKRRRALYEQARPKPHRFELSPLG